MKYANIMAFVGLASLLSACGGDDGDDGDKDTQSNANQPGGGEDDNKCTGTVTGLPGAGAVECLILVSYFAQANAVSNTGDVTILTVSGSVGNIGGISQNLVIRGRPMVQSYPELVNEPRMGILRLGSVGTLDFNDGSPSLFYGETGSVNLTAVGTSPGGSTMISGSATWDVASDEYAETAASATISLTFRDQY